MKKILTGVLAFSLLSIASVAFAQKVSDVIIKKCPIGQTWSDEQEQCVSGVDEHGCFSFQVWDEAQGKCVVKANDFITPSDCTFVKCVAGTHCENGECVSDTDEHGCSTPQVWSESQGKCVSPKKCVVPTVWNDYQGRCVAPTKCNAPQVWSSEQGQCITPEGPEYNELVNVPSLEHFTLEEGNTTDDDIYLVFAPKGNLDFRLHVYLYNEAGRDILDGWCTGDETLCKAVGNGRACPTLSIPGPSMSETVAPISNFSNRHTGENTWCYEGGSKSLKEAKVAEKAEKVEMVEKIKKVN